MLLEARDEVLARISFPEYELPKRASREANPRLEDLCERLTRYFMGQPGAFPLNMRLRCSPMALFLYSKISEIEFGKLISFFDLHAMAMATGYGKTDDDLPETIRKAVIDCPFPIIIPTHRVFEDERNPLFITPPRAPMLEKLRRVEKRVLEGGGLERFKDKPWFKSLDPDEAGQNPQFARFLRQNLHRYKPEASSGSETGETENIFEKIKNSILQGKFSARTPDGAISAEKLPPESMSGDILETIKKTVAKFGNANSTGDENAAKLSLDPELAKVLSKSDIAELIASTVLSVSPGFDLEKELAIALDSGVSVADLANRLAMRTGVSKEDVWRSPVINGNSEMIKMVKGPMPKGFRQIAAKPKASKRKASKRKAR